MFFVLNAAPAFIAWGHLKTSTVAKLRRLACIGFPFDNYHYPSNLCIILLSAELEVLNSKPVCALTDSGLGKRSATGAGLQAAILELGSSFSGWKLEYGVLKRWFHEYGRSHVGFSLLLVAAATAANPAWHCSAAAKLMTSHLHRSLQWSDFSGIVQHPPKRSMWDAQSP